MAIWEDLQLLFDLVDAGHQRYGVTEYNGGLFDSEAHPFLNEKCIADPYMARVIDQLGRAVDPLHPRAGLFRVDYRDLAIQHLGDIYEGLLELQPIRASEDMCVIRRRVKGRLEERYVPESNPLPQGWQVTDIRVRKGAIYFQTRKGERRATGSYYTPDHIVDNIVENTLGPLCKGVSDQLQREIEEIATQLAAVPMNEHPALQARRDELHCSYGNRI